MNLINAGRVHATGHDIEKIQLTISLWIIRVLVVAYTVFAVERIVQIVGGENIVIMSITLLASLASAGVHYRALLLFKQKLYNRAALMMMVANFVVLAFLQATEPGNSPLTGATFGLGAAVIASQMLNDRWSAIGIFMAFAGGSLIATFDYVIPGAMGGMEFDIVPICLMLVINIIFLYFLLRPFQSYQMNVKFLLTMSVLTIAAVVFTFISVYFVAYRSPSVDEELLMNMQRVAVISGAFFLILSGVVSFLVARFISRPLVRMIGNIQAIGHDGDFSSNFDVRQQGEVSYLAIALNDMNAYFNQISSTADQVSKGDLTVQVMPRSEKDLLGKSFSQMIRSLRQLVGLVNDSAQNLSLASGNLNVVVNNSQQVIGTIQQAVQHVLVSEDGNVGDSASFKQLARAIDSIARGAQEQAEAVSRAANFSSQIGTFVDKVSDNMEVVKSQSLDTAQHAHDGVQVMDEMVGQIENIRQRVGQSAAKVAEMGERSKQIEEIVSMIGSIASQTNLLALNTAIEAARSNAHTHAMAEKILDITMTAQAWLIAYLLKNKTEEMESNYFWSRLAEQCHLDDIYVNDGDGVVVYSNLQGSIGFRLSDDPKSQVYEFRQLIGREGGVVCQPLQRRSFDDKEFKYVGVCRLDAPGIVQVGFDGSSIDRYKSGGGVFSVISEEILQLANQTQAATKEIMELNQNIQGTVNEAVMSMIEGENEVGSGVTQAQRAREALNTILGGTDAIQQQIELAAASVVSVEQATSELAEAMDSVSAVVEENTAATEEMAASSTEVSESIHMIAQLAQDMTMDMNEISVAVQSLSGDVHHAQEVVRNFRLDGDRNLE